MTPRRRSVRPAFALALALAGCAGAGAEQRAAASLPGSAATLAIVGVAVADGTTPELRRDWTVVVRDGRIVEAGPASRVRAPRGATVVDGAGKYLVPGLWDMHVHLAGKDAEWLPLMVAHGVTSARDLGTLRRADADSMTRVVAGRGLPAPRLLLSTAVVEAPGSLDFMRRLAALAERTSHPDPQWERGHLVVTSASQAEAAGDSVVRWGGTMLKFIDPGSRANFDAIAAAARTRGLVLVGHAPQALRSAGPWHALDAGMRSFEHLWGFGNRALDTMSESSAAALAMRMREKEAAYVPTLLVSGQDAIPTDRFHELVDDPEGKADPRNRWISAHERSQWAVRLGMLRDPMRPAPDVDAFLRAYENEAAAMRRLHRLGAPILAGTDLGMYLVYPGSSMHEELALLVRDAGMTPFEALRSATLHPARWAGVADSVGTIRQGQRADLVLLDADPLADVGSLARIRAVVSGGRLLDRAALDSILAWRAR